MWQEFSKLKFGGKIAVLGSLASILALLVAVLRPTDHAPEQSIKGDSNTQFGQVGGNVTINSPPTIRKVDPQRNAQGSRLMAEVSRDEARDEIRGVPPKKWLETEAVFKQAVAEYNRGDYTSSWRDFDRSQKAYLDLYLRLKDNK